MRELLNGVPGERFAGAAYWTQFDTVLRPVLELPPAHGFDWVNLRLREFHIQRRSHRLGRSPFGRDLGRQIEDYLETAASGEFREGSSRVVADGRYTPDTGEIVITTGDPNVARLYANELSELYERNFLDSLTPESKFFSKQEFQRRLVEWYLPTPNFKIVLLRIGGDLVGFALGASLPPNTQWWKDVRESLPKEFTEEDGNRTLALLDIVVDKHLQGRGLGSLLHKELLNDRKEERATLLGTPIRQPAYSIWPRWGYKKIGTAQPTADAPILEVFVRQLARKSDVA